jgi:hypothetical protein
MNAAEYRAAIKALGLSQSRAARFLGVALSTSQRYAQGKSPVPQNVGMLLSVMLHLQIRPSAAREMAGLGVDDLRDGRTKEQ